MRTSSATSGRALLHGLSPSMVLADEPPVELRATVLDDIGAEGGIRLDPAPAQILFAFMLRRPGKVDAAEEKSEKRCRDRATQSNPLSAHVSVKRISRTDRQPISGT